MLLCSSGFATISQGLYGNLTKPARIVQAGDLTSSKWERFVGASKKHLHIKEIKLEYITGKITLRELFLFTYQYDMRKKLGIEPDEIIPSRQIKIDTS